MKKIYFYLQILIFSLISNGNISAAYRDSASVYGFGSDEKVEKFAMILGINAATFKYDLVSISQEFINHGVKNGKISEDVAEKFNEAFVFASGEGWLDVLGTFFACPIFMLTLDSKSAKDALINAANNDHEDVLIRFLMSNVFMDVVKRPLYSSDTKKEDKFLSEFNLAVKSELEKWTIKVFCTFFSSDNILNIIDKDVTLLVIERSINLGQTDLLRFILDNGCIRRLFKDELSSFLLELEKMPKKDDYLYKQMQNILNFKKQKSPRNNCTLF